MKLILQIALGVCLGITLSGILTTILGIMFFGTITTLISTQLPSAALKQSVVNNPPITSQQNNIDELLTKAGAIPENNTSEPTKPVTPPPTAQPTTPPIAEIRLAGKNTPTATIDADEQKVKEVRFKAYYQKSEKCLSPSDPQTRVECGNEYIRAKAKFEEIYKQGKF
jgi:hypothetical protein